MNLKEINLSNINQNFYSLFLLKNKKKATDCRTINRTICGLYFKENILPQKRFQFLVGFNFHSHFILS